jgi:hypothetical protein
MPQRLKMTTAEAERMFCVKIVDTPPPPLQSAIAPDPPVEPVEPAPTPAEIEAAADRRRRLEANAKAANKRSKGVPKALKPPVPPSVVIPPPPTDTRH